jgi:hypothetical protein
VIRTKATIAGGQIRVAPSFGDLVVCGRLGGRYVPAAHVWIFPATQQNARRLRASLRALLATPEFESLISGEAPSAQTEALHMREASTSSPVTDLAVAISPEPPIAVAPSASVTLAVEEPPLVLPDGILTQPWRHQAAAVRFALAKFEAGRHGLLLACGMGTGKTLIALIPVLLLKARRIIISCPLRVVSVWIGEIERHIGVRIVVVAPSGFLGHLVHGSSQFGLRPIHLAPEV